MTPALLVVGGPSVNRWPTSKTDRIIEYCGLGCTPPVREHWEIGGFAYGVDLGIRLLLR